MKYYILSGQLKTIVNADDTEKAACNALLNNTGVWLSPLICVSERGFDVLEHEQNEDEFFDTYELLLKTKMIGE